MHPDPLEAARVARLHTRQAFLDTVEMGSAVRRETEKAREHARRNGFGEGLEVVARRLA